MVRTMIAMAMVVMVVAGPGPAGAAEPHIVDPCGSITATREVVRPEHDVCGVWLSTLSDPRDEEEPVAIGARVRLAGAVDARDPSGYYLGWRVGECALLFLAEDGNTDLFPTERTMLVDCDGASRRTVPLSPDALTVDASGRDVTFTFTFVAELAGLAEDHDYGEDLVDLWAGAGGLVGEYPVGFYGWDDNIGTFSVLYDHASGGRPYTVGGA